jgi:hypothetical protein
MFGFGATATWADPLFFPIPAYGSTPQGTYCEHLLQPTKVAAEALAEANHQIKLLYLMQDKMSQEVGRPTPPPVLPYTLEQRLIAGFVLSHWFGHTEVENQFHKYYSYGFWDQTWSNSDIEVLWNILWQPCQVTS